MMLHVYAVSLSSFLLLRLDMPTASNCFERTSTRLRVPLQMSVFDCLTPTVVGVSTQRELDSNRLAVVHRSGVFLRPSAAGLSFIFVFLLHNVVASHVFSSTSASVTQPTFVATSHSSLVCHHFDPRTSKLSSLNVFCLSSPRTLSAEHLGCILIFIVGQGSRYPFTHYYLHLDSVTKCFAPSYPESSRSRAHKSSLHSDRYSRICVWPSNDFTTSQPNPFTSRFRTCPQRSAATFPLPRKRPSSASLLLLSPHIKV